ncbi:hypothetical protein ABKN59_008119 [Abortiporus biennis]
MAFDLTRGLTPERRSPLRLFVHAQYSEFAARLFLYVTLSRALVSDDGGGSSLGDRVLNRFKETVRVDNAAESTCIIHSLGRQATMCIFFRRNWVARSLSSFLLKIPFFAKGSASDLIADVPANIFHLQLASNTFSPTQSDYSFQVLQIRTLPSSANVTPHSKRKYILVS